MKYFILTILFSFTLLAQNFAPFYIATQEAPSTEISLNDSIALYNVYSGGLTTEFTVTDHTYRWMNVSFSFYSGNDGDGLIPTDSVYYGTQKFTLLDSTHIDSYIRLESFHLTAPTVGTTNIVIYRAHAEYNIMAGFAMVFSGVDQSTPIGTPVNDIGIGDSLSTVSVGSISGDEVIAYTAYKTQNGDMTPATSINTIVSQKAFENPYPFSRVVTMQSATTTTTVMRDTLPYSTTDWAKIGVAIKKAE